MKQKSDRDGKSKTASAVDVEHYPEQDEVDIDDAHDEIALRAYDLWRQRGCPEGSSEQDWFEAAEQVRAKANSRNARVHADSGSVQR
jgi:hypothetical protein